MRKLLILSITHSTEKRYIKFYKIPGRVLKSRNPQDSHITAILSVIENYKNRKIRITQDDLNRFNHLSCPNFKIEFESQELDRLSISAFDALEIFERDFNFLIGATVDEHLDGKGRSDKEGILAAIAVERASSLVGAGSKVTLARYRELVRATESGWRTLLAMKGISPMTVSQSSSVTLEDLRPVSAERLAA